MRVPSKLVEKTLSALQIAKVTGNIKTGLFENMRSLTPAFRDNSAMTTSSTDKNICFNWAI